MIYVSGIKQIKHSLLIIKIYGRPGFPNTDFPQLDDIKHNHSKNYHNSSLSLLPLHNLLLGWWGTMCFDGGVVEAGWGEGEGQRGVRTAARLASESGARLGWLLSQNTDNSWQLHTLRCSWDLETMHLSWTMLSKSWRSRFVPLINELL